MMEKNITSTVDLASVFPSVNGASGDASRPATVPSAPSEEDAPPPYTTMPRLANESGSSLWTGPGGGGAAVGFSPSGFKMGHMDFVPQLLKKHMLKEDQYEHFEQLIVRVNSWLEEHPGIQIVSCETLTWSGLDVKSIYSDSCSFIQTKNAAKKTKFLRGLRLWYFLEVFPSADVSAKTPIICVKTFIPKSGDTSFKDMMDRINKMLTSEGIANRVISVETVAVCSPLDSFSPPQMDPNACYWQQCADAHHKFIFCLRIFYLFGELDSGFETIGYEDFVPEYDQRNQESGGFEVFSDVMLRASRWIARQQGVRFTNIQSLDVKLKQKGKFEERCSYTEHLCAHNRFNSLLESNRPTDYLRILRAYFTIHHSGTNSSVSGSPSSTNALRLTYRTFTPAHLNSPKLNGLEWESMRQLVERVNQWLSITQGNVYSVETIPVRLGSPGCVQLLGPEATYSRNGLLSGKTWLERWLYYIRIYLSGEYLEPPGAVSLLSPRLVAAVHPSPPRR